MSLRDQFKAANTPQEGTKYIHNFGYSVASTMDENPILKTMHDCRITDDPMPDPRRKLPSYRAMWEALPWVERAIDLHTDFVGTPSFVAGENGNPKTVAALEKWWNESPIHGQWINDIAADRGLEQFVAQLITGTERDGSQFFHPYSDGPNTPITGLRMYDAARFKYVTDGLSEIARLEYQAVARLEYPTRETITEFHFDRMAAHLWGKPITYHGEFMAEILIRLMVAHKNGTIRRGDPIGITAIGYEPIERGTISPVDYADYIKRALDDARAVKDAHSQAVSNQRETSQSQDIVMTVPGKIDMKSSYYGQGIPSIDNIEGILMMYAKMIGMSLDTPMAFLGFDESGGGIGSEKFKVEKSNAIRSAQLKRNKLEAVIRSINARILRDAKILDKPDSYEIEWESPDMSDEKLEAEAAKIEAEAVAIQIQNYSAIRMELSIGKDPQAAANEYAEEIGRDEWVL